MRKRKNERVDWHVRLDHSMMDSAAFKTLSPNAVWLFVQMLRQFNAPNGGYGHLILPFADVRFKMSHRTFKRAQAELVDGGFLWLVSEGGLKNLLAGHGGAAVYAAGQGTALGERWKERSAALVKDPRAGSMRTIRRIGDDGRPRQVWEPARVIVREASRENWRRASKALERRRRPQADPNGRAEESAPPSSSRSREHSESKQ